MKYQLVFQFPSNSFPNRDIFDVIEEIENQIESKLISHETLDGHDIGSNEINEFIFTENPIETYNRIVEVFEKLEILHLLRVAYRKTNADNYNILWPTEQKEFKIL
jgi:hypothetical protein